MADSSGVRMSKACRACAKAKVRCDRENDETCKRCHRLGKECGGQAPGAHRRQKPTKNSVQVSALEAKLDRMVALMAASNPSPTQSSDLNSLLTQSPTTLLDKDPGIPNEGEGEILLARFTTKMVHLFPFVVIPANVTAKQLSQEKPFLFLNLSMAACQSASRQRDFSNTVKEYAAEHIILRNERSLDLLQGLLVFLAWFIGHSPVPAQTGEIPEMASQQTTQGPVQLDAFMQLALAQLISLHLGVDLSSPNRLFKPIGYVKKMDALVDSKPLRTLEERRTYLGCYYLTVMLSSCVRDMEPLRFTKYTDECCKVIEAESESPTDAVLVHLVRAMHLADRIVHTICFDDFDDLGSLSGPLGLSIRGFESDLRKLKASFFCESPYSKILNLHYDTLEILLYQVALSEQLSDAQCSGYTLTRLDILFRCLQATKSLFDDFDSFPSYYLTYMPFTFWCQFGHAVVALSRLSLFQSETGWDLEYVQNTVDFDQTIDRLMQKLEEARQLIERETGPRPTAQLPEVFRRLPHRMRLMKECHRHRKEALDKSRSQEVQDPAGFDFLFNMSFDTYSSFDDFLALGGGM